MARKAAAIPTFSPHDLRHRRESLLHLGRMPLGEDRASSWGHGDVVTTARTCTHVVGAERELEYVSQLT